jgi:hypothetical protein
MGTRTVTITLEDGADAAGFLGKLAYDSGFRAGLTSEGWTEALAAFGITVEESEDGEPIAPEITLPAREKVQRVIAAIHYPPNPPPFGMCKTWAAIAYAAGSTEDEEGRGETT